MTHQCCELNHRKTALQLGAKRLAEEARRMAAEQLLAEAVEAIDNGEDLPALSDRIWAFLNPELPVVNQVKE